jgi:hypothetical protein
MVLFLFIFTTIVTLASQANLEITTEKGNFLWGPSPHGLAGASSSKPQDERAERGGILSHLKGSLDREAPMIDLMENLFAVAEVAMDSDSLTKLKGHPELGFFEKKALAGQIIPIMEQFKRRLPKMQTPWHLASINVYVKRSSWPPGRDEAMPYSRNYCFSKADLIGRYDGNKEKWRKGATQKDFANVDGGVLFAWVEQISEIRGIIGKNDLKRSTQEKTGNSGVSATIWFTYNSFDRGKFIDKQQSIRAKYIGDLQWEIAGR